MSDKNNYVNKNDKLKKITSKYIVIRIFDNLNQNKLLNIIHYNKKYQKVMNIKLKDYKNEFSKIEIEIIPKENGLGKFINFLSNAQVYFNDKEIDIKNKKRKLISLNNITKIKIVFNHKIKSLSKLFYDCKSVKKINFIKFNRDDIEDMSFMFHGCSSLEEINFYKFNTNNVINMSSMFYGCSSLKTLNLSNFNTYNVTNMFYMFAKCSSLTELNLSNFNFNINNVTNMHGMFLLCSSLKELNISNFYTNDETSIFYMFFGCSPNLHLICTNDLIKKEYEKF